MSGRLFASKSLSRPVHGVEGAFDVQLKLEVVAETPRSAVPQRVVYHLPQEARDDGLEEIRRHVQPAQEKSQYPLLISQARGTD